MDITLISNPNSTSITSRSLRSIIPTLKSLSDENPRVRITSYFTSGPGHAQRLARRAREQRVECVIVIGGDGTVNEVINGLLDNPDGSIPAPEDLPIVGVIPTGSANVFARVMGFSPRPAVAVRQVVEGLRCGAEQRADAARWSVRVPGNAGQLETPGGGFFVVNAGFGIDADVIQAMDSARAGGRKATPVRYVTSTVGLWMQMLRHPPRVTVTCRDNRGDVSYRRADVPIAFVSVTNPWTFLGPIPVRIAPGARKGSGLSVFMADTMVGMRVACAAAGLVFAPLSRLADDVRHVRSGCQSVRLTLSGPEAAGEPQREFQVDGEHKDLSAYVEEGMYRTVDVQYLRRAVRVVGLPLP